MLEAAEADLALEAGFVHVKAPPGIPGNLAAKFASLPVSTAMDGLSGNGNAGADGLSETVPRSRAR